jgi:hypothetical protein
MSMLWFSTCVDRSAWDVPALAAHRKRGFMTAFSVGLAHSVQRTRASGGRQHEQ